MKTKNRSVFTLIILAVLAAVLCFTSAVGVGENKKLSIKSIKRGLDLNGGVSIVYKADK